MDDVTANAAIAEMKRIIDGMLQRNIDQAIENAQLRQALADQTAKEQTAGAVPGPGEAKPMKKEKRHASTTRVTRATR